MSKITKLLAAFIIGLLIFIFTMKIVGWKRVEEALNLFLSFKGLIIVGLTLIGALIAVFKWKFVLANITGDGEDRFKGLGKIYFAGYTITYLLTPMAGFGGEPFKAYFVKKKYGLDWRKSISSVVIERIFDWTVFSIFTMTGVLTLLFYTRVFSNKMIFLAVFLIGFLFFLLSFFYFKALKKESTLVWILNLVGIKREKIENSKNGKIILEIEEDLINFLSLKKKQFWKGISFSLLRYILLFLRAIFLILFLTGEVKLTQGLSIYGLTNISEIFPTPAGLGALEATGILSFKVLGLDMASGTIFAMVLRNANIVLCLIGGVFLVKIAIELTGKKIWGLVAKMKQ